MNGGLFRQLLKCIGTNGYLLVLGFFIGVKVVAQIHEEAYRKLILLLTALGAILIFIK